MFGLPGAIPHHHRLTRWEMLPAGAVTVLGGFGLPQLLQAEQDICSTIYKALGIDHEMPVYDKLGRPTAINHGGTPIDDILA